MLKKIDTPDFSVGCLEYSEVIARVTLSVVAPLDRSLKIIGDKGILYVPDIRNDTCPVYFKNIPGRKLENALEYRVNHLKLRLENIINFFPWNWGKKWIFIRKIPFVTKSKNILSANYKPVDFSNGPAELIDSIENKRTCVLSPEMALNVNETIELLQYPKKNVSNKQLFFLFHNKKITHVWHSRNLFDKKKLFSNSQIISHLFEMSNQLKHRGPDNYNYYIDEDLSIGLGFQRLSIQDLSKNGNQPMVSICKRFVIIFNGEIYNFKELKKLLKKSGYKSFGGSDTEILLNTISYFGLKNTLQLIHGMFAFALIDKKESYYI